MNFKLPQQAPAYAVYRLRVAYTLMLLLNFGLLASNIIMTYADKDPKNFNIVTEENYQDIYDQNKITFVVLTDDKKEGEEIRNVVAKAAVVFAPDAEEIEFGVWYPFDKQTFPKSIESKTPFLLAVGHGKATNALLDVPVTFENFFDSIGRFYKHFRTPGDSFSVAFGRSNVIEHHFQSALRECEHEMKTTESCFKDFAAKIKDLSPNFSYEDNQVAGIYEEKLNSAADRSLETLKKEEEKLRSKIHRGGSVKKMQAFVTEHNIILAISSITEGTKREMAGEL